MLEHLNILVLLLLGHFVADYPWQGDFLARAKNRKIPVAGVPWYQAMIAHCFIHAGIVFFFTQSFVLLLAEFMAHFVIDDLKCRGKINYNTDQFLHVTCKVIWVLYLINLGT